MTDPWKLLQEARTQLARTDAALRRLLADGVTQLEHIDAALAGEPDVKVRTVHESASDHMKCATRDCWLCHGVPENAGPR